MITGDGDSSVANGIANPDGAELNAQPCYHVLMLFKIRPGKALMQQQIFAMADQLVKRLASDARFTQIDFSVSYFSSEWNGWRLFEGHDLQKFESTLKELRKAPDPDPFTPEGMVGTQHNWWGKRYKKNGQRVQDSQGNDFTLSTATEPYPVNEGGIELDRWLDTKFIIGISKKNCRAPHAVTFGEEATITAEALDLLPASAGLPELLRSHPQVTFTIIAGAAYLRGPNGDPVQQVSADTDAEGSAQAVLAGEWENEDELSPEVQVFAHIGPAPEGGNYENVQGALSIVEFRAKKEEDGDNENQDEAS